MAEGGEPLSASAPTSFPQSFTSIQWEQLEFVKHLGSGGFGMVELHKHTNWGKVAVKQIIDKQMTPELREAIHREADKMYRAVSSRHVVTVMGMFDCPKQGICIVMEYMELGSLRHFTPLHLVSSTSDRDTGDSGNWQGDCWSMRMSMICQMILGMNYLHTLQPPILHRDLKLENIFVGQGYVIKIGDLGLSVSQQSAVLQAFRVGTVTHIPPEVLRGKEMKATRAWDLYSFGITLYEFISLTPDNDDNIPWPGFANTDLIENWVVKYSNRPDMRNILPNTPEFVIETMKKCWDVNPLKRPSFQNLKEEFTKVYDDKYEHSIDSDRSMIIARKIQRTQPPTSRVHALHTESSSTTPTRSKEPVQATSSTEANQEGTDSSTSREDNLQSPSSIPSRPDSVQPSSATETKVTAVVAQEVVNQEAGSEHGTSGGTAVTDVTNPRSESQSTPGVAGQVSTQPSERRKRDMTIPSFSEAALESGEIPEAITPLVSDDWQLIPGGQPIKSEAQLDSRVHTQPDSSLLGATGSVQKIPAASQKGRVAIPPLMSTTDGLVPSGRTPAPPLQGALQQRRLIGSEKRQSCDDSARPEQGDDFDESGCGGSGTMETPGIRNPEMTPRHTTAITPKELSRPFQDLNLSSSSSSPAADTRDTHHSKENGSLRPNGHRPSQDVKDLSDDSLYVDLSKVNGSDDLSYVDLSKVDGAGSIKKGPVPISMSPIMSSGGSDTHRPPSMVTSSGLAPQQEKSRDPATTTSQHIGITSSSGNACGGDTASIRPTAAGGRPVYKIQQQHPTQQYPQQQNHQQQRHQPHNRQTPQQFHPKQTRPPPYSNNPRVTPPRASGSPRPPSNADYPIKQQHIMKITKYIGKNSSKLGRYLGLDDAEIDTIKFDYERESLEEVNHQILKKWIGRQGNRARKSVLVAALKKADLANLANKL